MKLQIKIDGKIYFAEVEVVEEEDEGPAMPDYVPYQAPPPIRSARADSTAGGAGSDPKICRSPVAGLVIRVLVEPGQTVEANELVMVLEAMKMETNVMAQAAGTVKNVHAAPGEPVKLGQVLVEFE